MKKILVIGSLNMDVVVNMAHMPLVGETVMGHNYWTNPGGKGANQAFTVARLGGQVKMLGSVGNDEYGQMLIENLQQAGVGVEGIQQVEQATGTAFIFTDNLANNSIVVVKGANEQTDMNYILSHQGLMEEADLILLQMEIPEETVHGVIELAHSLGKTIILNPAPAPEMIPAHIWKKINYLTPNETELSRISGFETDSFEEIIDAGKALIKQGVEHVIVTIGEKGAIKMSQEDALHIPSIKVEAVDTTAAGDCFNGAFAVALSEGKSEIEAIEWANRAAAQSVTKKGAQMSIPLRSEI